MHRSAHPYAQPSDPPPRPAGLPLPLPTPTSSSSRLPSLPPPAPPPPRPLPPSPTRTSQQATAAHLPPSASAPDPLAHQQYRQRGESTPVHSRHSLRSDPFEALQFDAKGQGQGRPAMMRRQSSGPGGGTVSRRVVVGEDGREREETREERRARKERERAARGDGGAAGEGEAGLPPRPRLSDGLDFSSASLGAPPIPSSSSLPLAPPSVAGSSASLSSVSAAKEGATSSKSVLTTALQRAQSAVLLDSANNFPAAIAAYSQAVRLLKEVMARVEDGSREMERKLSTGGIRDGETGEEFERRKARYERKEKAKMDEARRLRVIHDTYEDRIRMLVQMGTPLPAHASPSLAALATGPDEPAGYGMLPNGAHASHSSPALSNESFPRSAAPSIAESTNSAGSSSTATPVPGASRPPSMVYRRHRWDQEQGDPAGAGGGAGGTRRSIALLQTVATPPTRLESSPAIGEEGENGAEGEEEEEEEKRGRREDERYIDFGAAGAAAEGIGSAMLMGPASPVEPDGAQRVPQIGSLPVFSSDSQRRGAEDDQTLQAPAVGEARPASALSDLTAVPTPSTATATSTAHPSPLSSSAAASPALRPPPSAFEQSTTPLEPPPGTLPYADAPYSPSSAASSEEHDEQPLHTALERPAAGWPHSHAQSYSVDADAAEAAERLAPLPALPLAAAEERRPSFASLAMRRGSSASALTTTSDATLRITNPTSSAAGGESMRRAASAQSSASWEMRPRPSRSASLAGSAAMGLSASMQSLGSQQGRQGGHLVNASVADGSILLRRRGTPQPGEGEEGRAGEGQGELAPPVPPQLQAQTSIVVRAPSSEVDRPSSQLYAQLPLPSPPSAPGKPASSTSTGLGLGRLRALSQPGSKRPKFQSFDSEQAPPRPPLPPLLSNATRSVSTTAATAHHPSASVSSSNGSVSRKPSIPTPTSLNPPHPLGRSNSSSSIGSSASSALRHERYLNGTGGVDTPSSAVFPTSVRGAPSPSLHHQSHPSLAGLPGAPYLAAANPSPPPSASSPASREAHLAIPAVRRPFHLMRLVVATIPSSSSSSSGAGGGYLSEKLFVPAQIWTTQGGAKLVAIETKVRMLDLLSTGLDAVVQAGKGLLLVPTLSSAAPRAARDEAARFARELEAFEGLAEGIQSTLGKKLGQGVIGAPGGGIAGGGVGGAQEKDPKTGRKGSTASFSAWSSKLSMSLNRVTNGVSLDSQATYVDAISKVFKQGQALDAHLALLFPSPSPSSPSPAEPNPYTLLADADRHRLERQLRKSSEFFGQVICRFVLRDVGVLLDKYVKRGGAWLSGE
ncbi:hypothetical protein JCM10207_000029 [Rhodosporidiobolus poonsookiae]